VKAKVLADLVWSQYKDILLQFQIGGENFVFLQSIKRNVSLRNTD